MKYDQEIAFKILKAMENYEEASVPSPYLALDAETGLPEKVDPTPRDFTPRRASRSSMPPSPPQTPQTTDPKSWIGQMDSKIFFAHAIWLKQEKLITTAKEMGNERPHEITFTGVRLLKEIEAKGGWEKSVGIADQAQAAATFTGMLEVLRKVKAQV